MIFRQDNQILSNQFTVSIVAMFSTQRSTSYTPKLHNYIKICINVFTALVRINELSLQM
jgi:hypothetical protein